MGNKPMTLMQLKQILRSILYGLEEGTNISMDATAAKYAASVGISREQVQKVLDTPLRQLIEEAQKQET